MKKIPWHNPAQQTPPKGYRLLIPEEVDGRFRTSKLPTTHFYSEANQQWDSDSVSAAIRSKSYAVPSDTPLPEGYALIDGDVWQMNGWTAHTPGDEMYINSNIPADTGMEVMLRNGEVVTAPMGHHWFGKIPKEPRAEIIGWRVVEQTPKPLMALDAEMDKTIEQMWAEAFTKAANYPKLLDENQRLKNELADAQATLKSIRSLLP